MVGSFDINWAAGAGGGRSSLMKEGVVSAGTWDDVLTAGGGGGGGASVYEVGYVSTYPSSSSSSSFFLPPNLPKPNPFSVCLLCFLPYPYPFAACRRSSIMEAVVAVRLGLLQRTQIRVEGAGSRNKVALPTPPLPCLRLLHWPYQTDASYEARQ